MRCVRKREEDRYEPLRIQYCTASDRGVDCSLPAQALRKDLGPRVQKLAEGVYVHTGKGFDSNSGIIVTEEGVIVVDTGQNPVESRDILEAVKKLTSLPVRIVIDTEPHADHTTGHFVFPQAIVIAAEGGGDSMRAADKAAPTASRDWPPRHPR
jgi:glyoxylase-like metal-dependent hydrolase (beta-lactamase superfamily II)